MYCLPFSKGKGKGESNFLGCRSNKSVGVKAEAPRNQKKKRSIHSYKTRGQRSRALKQNNQESKKMRRNLHVTLNTESGKAKLWGKGEKGGKTKEEKDE